MNIRIWGGASYVRALTLSTGVAAFRPTGTFCLKNYDLYPPEKVVSSFKGAVPPLTNSRSFFGIIR